ncbi:hypothetical protein Tco_1457320 [Tanacetum coccineum]
MVVRSLDVEKDPFQPSKDDKDILGPEQDIAHVLRGGIGMGSNKYFDIFKVNLVEFHEPKMKTDNMPEDNATFICSTEEGLTEPKHISPKFFFTHDLQKEW